MNSEPESDDDLWRRSQWDEVASFEEPDCRYREFYEALRSLLTALNKGQVQVSSNADIISLKDDRNKLWWRYVDPAASASNGTREGTAIFLWECLDHMYTLKIFEGKWGAFRGHETKEYIDIVDLHPDRELRDSASQRDRDDDSEDSQLLAEAMHDIANDDLSTFDADALKNSLKDIFEALESISDRLSSLEDAQKRMFFHLEDLKFR